MADIRPFAGIRYARRPGLDFSSVIAPPYDVLDEAGKAALQAKHPENIVTIDLPFLPPKSVGPDSVYEGADITLKAWLAAGVLKRDTRQALYPYSQSYTHNGRTYHRRGFIALVRLTPFGAGGDVVPHEKTYKGPIEDRLKLMHATRAQLSPIFGLYSDPKNDVTNVLYENLVLPELSGTLDGVQNNIWSVIDAVTENKVIDLMGTRKVYIADGHHRYTTALQYQKDMEAANGGPLPPHHPANWCMFVLVGMQDPGLLILPTHRLIGGLVDFSVAAFADAVRDTFDVVETPLSADHVDEFINNVLPLQPAHTMGLYDGREKKLYQLTCKNPDILAALEPNQSEAWRQLDVAILQRYLLDEVLTPKFSGGKDLVKGYSADPFAVAGKTDGTTYQIALLLKSTPLGALQQLGERGEVMPQKSTYFYPKVVTGAVINPLE